MLAAEKQHLDMVEYLVTQGADVSQQANVRLVLALLTQAGVGEYLLSCTA